MKLAPDKILELLDVEAVLIPIIKGSKRTSQKSWQNLTFSATQEPCYQKILNKASAIGVVLQTDRTSLCSIDIDDDELLKVFLTQNLHLMSTLRTKGKKGGNIWLMIKGEFPITIKKLKYGGEPAGEWRVNNAYTIITGKHPDGIDYHIVNEAPLLEIEFSEIDWQGFAPFSEPCPIDDTDGIDSLDDTDNKDDIDFTDNTVEEKEKKGEQPPPNSTTTIKSPINILEKIKASDRAMNNLVEDKEKYHLYREYIERRYTAQQGERNSQLIAMTTFLFHALAEKLTIPLVKAFFEVNQTAFIDTLETHLYEAQEQLNNVKQRWIESLNEKEKEVYEQMIECGVAYTDSFRICRELHRHGDDNSFYLSYDNLGRRLGVLKVSRCKKGERILNAFVGSEIIKLLKKGTKHSKDGVGKATVYRWFL